MSRFLSKSALGLSISGLLLAASPAIAAPFISEIHYDNTGGDTGEAIEVAAAAGTDLAGCSLVLYNGSNGTVYSTLDLCGRIDNEGDGYGAVFFEAADIQNGAPDGLALVDSSGTVLQFLSYEGSFTATGGPALGLTSTDIGVSETGSTQLAAKILSLSMTTAPSCNGLSL